MTEETGLSAVDERAPKGDAPDSAQTDAAQSDASQSDAARLALFDRFDELTAEEGHFEPVGARHWALFEDRGTSLIVSFERLDSLLGREGQMPWAQGLATAEGWSHLCLIADGETWYRDEAVYRYFDRLVDDAFFEDFDRVLFYGHGHGAHAACAFAVTAPGAQVLALNPCATLAGAEVSWDRRRPEARRLDFTSRYGYAPEMLEGAGKVVVIHDLTRAEEAMHSALFRAPWVTRLNAPLMGEGIEHALRHMGVLPQLVQLAMEGKLTRAAFAGLWRKRRAYSPYLRALLDRAETARQKTRAIAICRSVSRRLKAPWFAKRLAKLTGEK